MLKTDRSDGNNGNRDSEITTVPPWWTAFGVFLQNCVVISVACWVIETLLGKAKFLFKDDVGNTYQLISGVGAEQRISYQVVQILRNTTPHNTIITRDIILHDNVTVIHHALDTTQWITITSLQHTIDKITKWTTSNSSLDSGR